MLRLREIRDNACQLHARCVHCYVTAISQLLSPPATGRLHTVRLASRATRAIVLLEIALFGLFR